MAGRQPQELEQLEKGLEKARPLDGLLRQLAESNEAEALYQKGVYYTRWTGQMMAVAGIYFLALKQKVDHGHFKKLFSGKNRLVSYMHAWQCMKAAHVVAEHPAFGELRTSRAFLKLMLLPAPERAEITEQLKHIPDEQIQQLLPDIIQERYDELTDERRKARPPKKKNISDEEAQKTLKLAENLVTELDSLVAKALSALRLIAEYKISAQESERAKRYQREVEAASSRAAYNLGDPEHKKPPWWERDPKEDDISEEGATA